MTRILLIRHGHTEMLGKILYGRMPGVHLSEQGRQEISRLAGALNQRYRIDEIVSSPMDRARETATAIAALQTGDIVIDDGLQELDFGEWTGRSFADLVSDERWKRYNRYRSLTGAPAGEFMMQVQFRAWNALERAVARHSDRAEPTIALVSHGDVVRALLLLFLGMPLDHIHRIEVSTGSVSEVIVGNAHPRVINLNQTF
jgi:probable phosphoglycerate mutase